MIASRNSYSFLVFSILYSNNIREWAATIPRKTINCCNSFYMISKGEEEEERREEINYSRGRGIDWLHVW